MLPLRADEDISTAQTVILWAIEYVRSPNTQWEDSGLLCVPLPWEEGECIQAAPMIFESQPLAEAGLEHYLLWSDQRPSSYRLLPLTAQELIEILETRPEGGGFDRVAINPILSRYFRDAVGLGTP